MATEKQVCHLRATFRDAGGHASLATQHNNSSRGRPEPHHEQDVLGTSRRWWLGISTTPKQSTRHYIRPCRSELVSHIRNQGELSRPLNRSLQFALMWRACTRQPPRLYLAPFGNTPDQHANVLVIDKENPVDTKSTNTLPAKHAAFRPFGIGLSRS